MAARPVARAPTPVHPDTPPAHQEAREDPLERLKRELARAGGFAVVNDESASGSYRDGESESDQ